MQGPGLLEPICVGLSLLVPLELFSAGLVCSRRRGPGARAGDAEAVPPRRARSAAPDPAQQSPGWLLLSKLIKPSARRVFLFISM